MLLISCHSGQNSRNISSHTGMQTGSKITYILFQVRFRPISGHLGDFGRDENFSPY